MLAVLFIVFGTSTVILANPHRNQTQIQAPRQRIGNIEVDWFGLTHFHVSNMDADRFVFYNDLGPNPSQRWFREGMREAGLQRFMGSGVIWGWRDGVPANLHYNSGSLQGYSNTLFCINPGNTRSMGISSTPEYVLNDILLYQTIFHVMADPNATNESVARSYLWLRSLLYWDRDARERLLHYFEPQGLAHPLFFASRWRATRTPDNTPISFFLIDEQRADYFNSGVVFHDDNSVTGPRAQYWEVFNSTWNNQPSKIYRVNAKALMSNWWSPSYPSGPFFPSIQNQIWPGTERDGLIDDFMDGPDNWINGAPPAFRMEDFGLSATAMDGSIVSFTRNGDYFEFNVPCEPIQSSVTVRIEYRINPVLTLDQGLLVAFQTSGMLQNGAKISNEPYTFDVTIVPSWCELYNCPPIPHNLAIIEEARRVCEEEQGGIFDLTWTLPLPCGHCDLSPRAPRNITPRCASSFEIIEQIPLRWYNLGFSWAESKIGEGYNPYGRTEYGRLNLSGGRNTEPFEALMGTPETSRIFVNGGSSEAVMDVQVRWYDIQVELELNWRENHICNGHIDSDGNTYYRSEHIGNPEHCLSFNHSFRFIRLVEASYSTPSEMHIYNPALFEEDSFVIPLNDPQNLLNPHHFLNQNLAPSTGRDSQIHGLLRGPGADPLQNQFNMGSQNNWSLSVDVGTFYSNVCMDVSGGPYQTDWAINLGNQYKGELNAQNDELVIVVGGYSYIFTERNIQTAMPFGQNSQLHAAPNPGHFRPHGENFCVMTYVPRFGYSGRPEADTLRNRDMRLGTSGHSGIERPFVLEDIKISSRQTNGVICFAQYAENNIMVFGNRFRVTPDSPLHDFNSTTENLLTFHPSQRIDPTNPYHYLVGTHSVKLEYIDWQLYEGLTYTSHGSNQPDGEWNSNFNDAPTFHSINPVIVHNPVGIAFARHSDITNNILEDQRILPTQNITRMQRATENHAPSRSYISFDFKLELPRAATFENYWSSSNEQHHTGTWEHRVPIHNHNPNMRGLSTHHNNTYRHNPNISGILDFDGAIPGTVGKGFTGSYIPYNADRSYNSPYVPYLANTMDVNKYTNAIYVRFPVDIIFYGDIGEGNEYPTNCWSENSPLPGSDPPGFYFAGDWVMLFNKGAYLGYENADMFLEIPDTFHFSIQSHQPDVMNGSIEIMAESINVPLAFRSEPRTRNAQGEIIGTHNNAENLWLHGSEFYVNGRRFGIAEQIYPLNGTLGINRGLSARHASIQQLQIDVIGRLGDVNVNDIGNDAAWTSIFFNTRNGDGRSPITERSVNSPSRFYAKYYNLFEVRLQGDDPWQNYQYINRFGTLSTWFRGPAGAQRISNPNQPIGINRLPILLHPFPPLDQRSVKMGYEVQGSISVIGDYGRENSRIVIMPRYTAVGNFTSQGLQAPFEAPFKLYAQNGQGVYQEFWDSRITNGRAYLELMNPQIDRFHMHHIGHNLTLPRAKINISGPQGLREIDSPSFLLHTQLGSLYRRIIGQSAWLEVDNNLRTNIGGTVTNGRLGRIHGGTLIASNQPNQAWTNASRFHFRHSVPDTTRIKFIDPITGNPLNPRQPFENRTRNQSIYTEFVFRTISNNGLWDLSTHTNTGNQGLPDNRGNVERPPVGFPPGPITTNPADIIPVSPNHPPRIRPGSAIIIYDYSNPSYTDLDTIGTH